jgi:chromosome segregation protein
MLKSLEMFGFKSFADRTRFDFSRGITCVVGPNGSGKSNVVDSIKWVLGDQSPKSLRGKEMTDVIFNGASGRKPAAFAEVLLTFDNSSRCLNLDAAEVQIGRRLWRSGDSEYLINQQPARLKDIKDLFLGTGAGASAYSIIEQGRVDQILQSNAAARRQVFEEAAGVSRYKARKEEATRKLERVEQNLLRLRDIVDEVESQLNSMRSQASKAAKYREISHELRQWWFGLAADDHRHLSAQLARVEAELQSGEAELAQLSTQQQELESQLAAFDTEIAAADARLREVERIAASHRESIVRQEATLRHLDTRQKELGTELDRLRRQRSLMLARKSELVAELRSASAELANSEAEHRRLKLELAASDAAIARFADERRADQARLDRERERQTELMQQTLTAQQRVQQLNGQLEAAQSAVVATSQKISQCDADLVAAQSDVLRAQAAAEIVLAEVAALDGQVREVRDQQQRWLAERDQCQERLRSQREERSAKQSQQAVLEDLERRQEGLGVGVKEILNRALSSDLPPWNSILGSVADLIEADLDEAAILEVALGARAELIVVRELAPIIEYLTSETTRLSGRVGFWELATARATDFLGNVTADAVKTTTDLSHVPGVITRADQLASLKSAQPGLAEQLLGTTWVVDTLATALQLSADAGRGCRFVTLQGELLEADGTLYAGTVRSESAVLTRRSELRRLKNDLLKLDRAITDGEREFAQVTRLLQQAEQQLESTTTAKQELADRLAQARLEVTTQRQAVERLSRERDQLLAEAARCESLASELVLQIEQARREHAWFEDNLASLSDALSALEAEVARRDSQRQALLQQQVDQRLKLAAHEERVQALRSTVSRLHEDQEQRDEQFEEADRRLNAAAAQMRQLQLQMLNTNAELWELQAQGEQFATQVAAALSAKEELRQRKGTLSEQEARLRAARRELADRLHANEILCRDARHQLQSCAARIEEEYQLTLDEVVASGASAFALWREELQGSEGRGQESEADPAETGSVEAAFSIPAAHESGEALDAVREPLDAVPSFLDIRPELEERVHRLRRKLKMLGSVNTDSLRDLDELEERYQHLHSQLQDLEEAKATLTEIIRQVNAESQRLFLETLETIRVQFQQLFRKMFGGGEGDIILEDPNDVLDCGIDIVARPPGKELRSISLLSGGEKTMTAVALLMAIFRSKPSPFCILDEVDAALDEANVERYSSVVKEFKQATQFIMITHNKRSMQIGDILYGVTMEQSGVSKRMSVRFEDVSEDGHFRVSPAPGSHAA